MLYFVFIYSYLLNGTEIHGNPCGIYFTKLITITHSAKQAMTRALLIYIENIVLSLL